MIIPSFQIEEIEQLVGNRCFQQGKEYAHSGAVIEMQRQGNLLTASCVGSSRNPYKVEANFDGQGLVESQCSCPVGNRGQCKHVAALLIKWIESPQSFVEIEPWDTVLGRFQRRDLIDVLLQLIERRPELERVIEGMLPKGERAVVAAVTDYDRLVADAIAQTAPGSSHDDPLVARLLAIKEAGDQWAKQQELVAAAAVYQAIVRGVLQNPDRLSGQPSALSDLIQECVENLGTCLFYLDDQPQLRQPILRTLLDLYCFDVAWGGMWLSFDLSRMILAHVTKPERAMMADWVRVAIPAAKSAAARRTLGGFLLEILGQQIEEMELFDVCRRTDRIFDLVRRLVLSGRLTEALEEAPKADDGELLQIADLLVRLQSADAAGRLVQQRAASSQDPRLQQWLNESQASQQQCQAMLDLAEQLFRLQPDFETYQRVRDLARQAGAWDKRHPQLLQLVEQAGNWVLLIRIHLEENDIDRALEVVAQAGDRIDEGLAGRVAKAAENSRPVEALHLYQTIAERRIARRGRDNYVEADRYLRKVRKLMQRTGNGHDWQKYLGDLCQRYRPLQALYADWKPEEGGEAD